MKNSSTNKYDEKLKLINHYLNFPSMMPYIGKKYGELKSKKLLVIAESHYFPKNSSIHLNAEQWYESDASNLTEEEIYYINTRSVLETDWNTVSDVVFKQINSKIQPFVDNSEERAMNYVAFMNCFQRPGETGESIQKTCNHLDIQKSYSTVNSVINAIKPDIILFTSKFAWDNVGLKVCQNQDFKNQKFEFSCHPATGGRYWHNKNYEHNSEKISSFLENELN